MLGAHRERGPGCVSIAAANWPDQETDKGSVLADSLGATILYKGTVAKKSGSHTNCGIASPNSFGLVGRGL